MPFNQKMMAAIAHLARIDIASHEAEEQAFEKDLQRIVSMVDQISKANTENVLPMSHSQDIGQRLRPDIVTEKDEREILLSLAPHAEAGLFLVPQVME